MSKHTCRYILRPARVTHFAPPLDFVQAEYCGRLLRYKMKVDPETGLKRRVYEAFCSEHAHAAEDDEE